MCMLCTTRADMYLELNLIVPYLICHMEVAQIVTTIEKMLQIVQCCIANSIGTLSTRTLEIVLFSWCTGGFALWYEFLP